MADRAREASLYALGRCRRDGAWSAQAIAAAAAKFRLSGRDTAFASRLTLGVIENTALCDYYIGLFSSASPDRLEPKVLDILRLSAYQLIFMDRVPASAAVNEGVWLCRRSDCGKASGLVNAVLRRISEKRDALPEIPGKGGTEYLSVKYSHPKWLADELISEYGYDFTEAFLAANNQPAPLYIQVNTLKTDAVSLTELFNGAGVKSSGHPLLSGCLRVDNPGLVTALPGFEDGLFYVQDPAARFCIAAAVLLPGMTVLDACAAPGGKSFAAAIAMGNAGKIVSRDMHEKKTKLISSGAERLGISIIETAALDAREKTGEQFDVVFADVPCSGLGVIRSKPEIRYRERGAISGLPGVQLAIIENLADNVKPGGVLMYSTCTVLSAENEGVVRSFLSKRPDFRPEGFGAEGELKDGMRTFWPQTDGTDGFFICRLRKRN